MSSSRTPRILGDVPGAEGTPARPVPVPVAVLAETCEPGPWSEWSVCAHESRTCGCKWGVETRVREVPEAAREDGTACPARLETRRCRMKKHCPGGEHRLASLPREPEGRGRSTVAAGLWQWPASRALISQAF